jgi:hypothetical protein
MVQAKRKPIKRVGEEITCRPDLITIAPWTDGLSLLSHARSVDNDLAVILITDHSDIAMAVNAMRQVRRADGQS